MIYFLSVVFDANKRQMLAPKLEITVKNRKHHQLTVILDVQVERTIVVINVYKRFLIFFYKKRVFNIFNIFSNVFFSKKNVERSVWK